MKNANNVKIKISVIIPAYNAEKIVSTCLESLVKQTLKDIEIIVINDGSTDNTKKIIDDYTKKHSNIKMISTKNNGVYKARELGVEKSAGEYISFVDSDDTVESNFCELLYENAKKYDSDIAVCAFKRILFKTNKIISLEMTDRPNIVEVKDNLSILTTINTSLWNKLYKSTILKNRYKVKNIPRISEDVLFLYSLYPIVNKISFISIPLYNYLVNDTSAMQTFRENDIDKIESSILELKSIYEKDNPMMNVLYTMVFFNYSFVLSCNINKNYLKIYRRTIKFLNTNFPRWKKIGKLGNFKINIIFMFYIIGLGWFPIGIYRFINNKLKISLKW